MKYFLSGHSSLHTQPLRYHPFAAVILSYKLLFPAAISYGMRTQSLPRSILIKYEKIAIVCIWHVHSILVCYIFYLLWLYIFLILGWGKIPK